MARAEVQTSGISAAVRMLNDCLIVFICPSMNHTKHNIQVYIYNKNELVFI